VAAGAAALGRPLGGGVPLDGSDRSAVLRCADSAGGTVIVKTYPADEDGAASFAAEAAGLALTGGAGLGPRLLAAGRDTLTVVMSDLGSAPSLADLLLGGDRAVAGAALLDWAAALGELAAAGHGRAGEHAALLAEYLDGRAPFRLADALARRIAAAPERAALAGARLAGPRRSGARLLAGGDAGGLAAELAEITGLVRSAEYPAFSPGDVCPDNSLLTPAGVRFVDHETAGYDSVFLTAAYLRMPFSSCWCAFSLPPGLAARAESAYRAAVTRLYPEMGDDGRWQRGVRLAVAAWTLHAMGWLLARALQGNEPLDDLRTAPRPRTLMRFRWRMLAAELEQAGELPALAALMRELLDATEQWQVPELGGYPALP
jgi:hypothetical protein